jgi:hypothetical protein
MGASGETSKTVELKNKDENGKEYLELTYTTETPCAADDQKMYQTTF